LRSSIAFPTGFRLLRSMNRLPPDGWVHARTTLILRFVSERDF